MRTFGIFLLGLGMMVLIPSGFAVAATAPTRAEALGWLVFAGLPSVVLIIGGIRIVRREEDRQAVQRAMQIEDAYTPPDEGAARVQGFDLNRLNGVGWLLLILSFAFVVAGAGGVVFLAEAVWLDQTLAGIVAFAAAPLAVGFFAGVRWLLGRFGISIYRR